MREILFRGKRMDNDEWTEGYLFKIWHRAFLLWGMTGDVPNMVEVKPETVGEYINRKGMDDKMIFEGDIIVAYRTMFPHSKYKFVITPDYCKWRSDYPFAFLNNDNYNLKIIGNIHDNPDLIKKKK